MDLRAALAVLNFLHAINFSQMADSKLTHLNKNELGMAISVRHIREDIAIPKRNASLTATL